MTPNAVNLTNPCITWQTLVEPMEVDPLHVVPVEDGTMTRGKVEDSIWEQLEEENLESSVQIRRVTLCNPWATQEVIGSGTEQKSRPKMRREREVDPRMALVLSLEQITSRSTGRATVAPGAASATVPIWASQDARIPDEIDPTNPCFAGPTHVKHYESAKTREKTREEIDFVRDAARQMLIATTRHRKQLYMIFVEDARLRELQEETERHLKNK